MRIPEERDDPQGCRHSAVEFAALFGHRSHMFRVWFFDLVSVSGMHLSQCRFVLCECTLPNLFILKPNLNVRRCKGY